MTFAPVTGIAVLEVRSSKDPTANKTGAFM